MTEKRSNSTQPQKDNFYQTASWFYPTLFGIAFLGSILAFSAPLLFPLPQQDDDRSVDTIRQLIFFLTGGILAVFTLIETHLKNRSLQNKHSFARTRQVHTERRVRYITAIEQIADANHSIRMGGIYTLIGLVDEWLADDNINGETRTKEGQVIINNLCSYIRSPFTLALKAEMLEGDSEPDNYEGDFSKDQAAFREEQDVRRTIFVEMSKRSSTFTKNDKGEIIETVPGIWSDFDFDFSRAPIFYPLSSLTIVKGNFSSAKFYSNADFSGAAFTQHADFSGATFTQHADFSGATFTQHADFSGATFTRTADFTSATFTQTVNFSGATFTQTVDFSGATFTQTVDFNEATFERSEPTFATKLGKAQFSAGTSPQNYMFSVTQGSKPIHCGWAEIHGKPFIIPVGTVLFDTDSWDEEKQKYTRVSEPAKPIEEPDNQGETPSK